MNITSPSIKKFIYEMMTRNLIHIDAPNHATNLAIIK